MMESPIRPRRRVPRRSYIISDDDESDVGEPSRSRSQRHDQASSDTRTSPSPLETTPDSDEAASSSKALLEFSDYGSVFAFGSDPVVLIEAPFATRSQAARQAVPAPRMSDSILREPRATRGRQSSLTNFFKTPAKAEASSATVKSPTPMLSSTTPKAEAFHSFFQPRSAKKTSQPAKKLKDDDEDFVMESESESDGVESEAVGIESEADSESEADLSDGSVVSLASLVSKKKKPPAVVQRPGAKPSALVRKADKERRIEHCPSAEQASQMAKKSEEKAKLKLWPPLSDLADIYGDIVDRMPEPLLKPLAQTLAGEGRSLRVATMCSGTESPLLALNMISRAVEAKWGIKMGIDHVFSCELEPFKQAYIERNFNPPLLFRDVTELGNAKAHTAYGALVDVPGDIDLLVAGTSCVDYSGLNNKKKTMSEGGESGRTFFGMLEWVKRHQPAIVILENVKSAPWQGVCQYFEEINYDTAFSTRFDTKNYYIPQTRQRGYFIATRNDQGDYPRNWHNLVLSMQRPASSPIEAFMLPTSDPRIQTSRAKLGHEQSGKSRSTIDWSKCQGRHEDARGFEKLGQARPFTNWEEGGSCVMSHGAWNEFARPQPERVLDLMDITVLRDAKKGEDPHFKSRVWELSQNVDRNIVAPQPGITGCLTPSGMPFLTSRGGPVTGLEALSLQALPINELLLTRESDDQLQNLAGNAMTSTVVGICILSALVLTRPDLENDRQNIQGTERLTKSSRQRPDVDIAGDEELIAKASAYDVVSLKPVDMPELLKRAVAASQLCICEGAAGIKPRIFRCRACEHTACDECKSRPVHDFEVDERTEKNQRASPRAFEDHLKEALPMRLHLQEESKQLLADLQAAMQSISGCDYKEASTWLERVQEVLPGAEFRFSCLKRQRTWTAEFHANAARMDLLLDPQGPHWVVYVDAAKSEPEGSLLRRLLLQPVARLRLDATQIGGTLLDAGSTTWEVNVPSRHRFKVEVTSHGDAVDSWEASMGIRGEFEGRKRYSRVSVATADKVARDLMGSESVEGEYKLLQECGQANASLHQLVTGNSPEQGRPLYFFIDAARYGSAKDDSYVFSRQLGLLPYPAERELLTTLEAGWKPAIAPTDLTAGDEELTLEEYQKHQETFQKRMQQYAQKKQTVTATLCGKWVSTSSLRLSAFQTEIESSISIPEQSIALNLNAIGCEQALALLYCSAPLTRHIDDAVWPSHTGNWTEVDLEHHASQTFAMLAWLMERVPEVKSWREWMSARFGSHACSCTICAPAAPSIQWLKKGTTAPIPIENEQEAGPYEKALKNRPFPFLLHLRTQEHGIAEVRISVNAATLMHRALSRLPSRPDGPMPELTWRLTRIDPELTQFNVPEYRLSSNRHDVEAPNPTSFKLELRKEQKRSLTWMLQQEAEDVKPFIEEEVSESTLDALEWCAEGRARQERVVRGGVIADAVGYGKTAISLALIASQKENDRNKLSADIDEGFIGTKATLVIVPPQLCKQWENEVHKFTGKKLSVHVIFSKQDLNKTTIELLQRVDVVIMSVSVYKSDAYFDSLAAFAAANPIPQREGRFFDSALAKSVAALRNRVKELKQDDRGRSLWQSIKARKDFDPSHLTTYKAQKRIVGAQYAREKALQDVKDVDDGLTAEDAWEQIKKQKISDVWGVRSGLKRWTDLTSPPLEAFLWRRVIIDEFHYIAADAGRVFSAVRALSGRATWVLSGTPQTGDFADIRSMAAFLNIHLGVEDDADYADVSTRGRSSRNKTRSDVERFRHFVEVHSPAWHHRRQAIGQQFLDRFVRQNVAEIDEIASIEILKPVRMPAAERACYLELQHTIEALDLRHARTLFRGPARAKGVSSENDRDHRLRITLGESSSPEEALSRQAAHFVLSSKERAQNAIEACDLIVEERAQQLARCREELAEKLKAAREQHFIVLLHYGYRDSLKQALVTFARNAIHAKYGDKESKEAVAEILRAAECSEDELTAARGKQIYSGDTLKAALKRRATASALEELSKERGAAAKKTPRKKRAGSDDSDEEIEYSDDNDEDRAESAAGKKAIAKALKDLEAQLAKSKKGNSDDEERQKLAWAQETHIRALVHQLVQLRNETAARQRSLRYFENIRAIQLCRGEGLTGHCPGCKSALTFETLALSSVCGHLSCEACGVREAWKGKCCEPGCNADAKPGSIVKATSLGVENEKVSAFGEKMSQLAHLLRDPRLIPAEDKVILFVQFDGLLEKTAHALHSYGIRFTRVKGNARQRSQTLDDYQNGRSPRVLLLDVADESAAGSNLTIANHVIFLSTLIADDTATYRSTMQQAKGRCLRFGQTKEVHLWHLVARMTIDEDAFNLREGRDCTLETALERRSDRAKRLGRQMDLVGEREKEAAVLKKKAPQAANEDADRPFEVADDSSGEGDDKENRGRGPMSKRRVSTGGAGLGRKRQRVSVDDADSDMSM